MIELEMLPGVNAILNSLSALLVAAGYLAIRAKRVLLHKTCMLAAVAVSALFLTSYLYYHFMHGHTPFPGTGPVAYVYFFILTTHTVLAIPTAPLVIITAALGVSGRLRKHVQIARWTLPIWLYVSITGVIVYFMLYRLFPPI